MRGSRSITRRGPRPIERKPKPAAEPRLRRKKTKPLDSLKRGKWSDEEVAELRRLVAQRPRLSAVEIAYKLNREADSVRGALKEHGLSLRGPAGSPAVVCKASLRLPPNEYERKPASEPKRSKSKGPKSKRQKPKTQPERLKTQPEKPRSQPATRFADLAAHQCRFPVGNDQPGPDMACCGQAVVDITATTGLRATHCADCLKKMVAPAWQ